MATVITNAPTTIPLPLFGVPPLPVRRFSVAEYHKLIDAGILTEDNPVELLEGWIVPKMTRKPPHDGTIDLANGVLLTYVVLGWFVRIQQAIATADSEPEPDLVVVRGDRRSFLQRHPGPTDIGLLIEVSDTTLSQDRHVKGRLYAHSGIPSYWIINLADGWIEVYTDPDVTADPPVYRTRTDYRPGQQVPLVLDGKTVAMLPVADLLP